MPLEGAEIQDNIPLIDAYPMELNDEVDLDEILDNIAPNMMPDMDEFFDNLEPEEDGPHIWVENDEFIDDLEPEEAGPNIWFENNEFFYDVEPEEHEPNIWAENVDFFEDLEPEEDILGDNNVYNNLQPEEEVDPNILDDNFNFFENFIPLADGILPDILAENNNFIENEADELITYIWTLIQGFLFAYCLWHLIYIKEISMDQQDKITFIEYIINNTNAFVNGLPLDWSYVYNLLWICILSIVNVIILNNLRLIF